MDRKRRRIFIAYLVWTPIVILLIVCAAGGGKCCMAQQNELQNVKYYKVKVPPLPQAPSMENGFYSPIRKEYHIDDNILAELKHDPPVSSYFEEEKKFYKQLLEGQTYDVMIVPFQTQANGIDHVGRMLMTYRLALAIESHTAAKVVPLPVLYPALGSTARYYDEKEIQDLAKRLGVSRIIWGYAGNRNYPDKNNYQVTFSIVDQKVGPDLSATGSKYKRWDYHIISADTLPSQYFESKLDEVLTFLNIPLQSETPRRTEASDTGSYRLDDPQKVLASDHYSRIEQSYLLQFFAMLAPCDYQKTRLFVRSIANVYPVDPADADRRLIEARAYIHLYRRPAAVKVLKGLKTKEATALEAFVNANLPTLAAKVAVLEPSIKRLLAELEWMYLRNEYKGDINDKEKQALLRQYPQWKYFLSIRLNHYNGWKRASNIDLKIFLDRYFPIKGFTIEDMAPGYAVAEMNAANLLPLELLFRKHLQMVLKESKSELAAMRNSNTMLRYDFLSMAESAGIFNLLQEIEFEAFTQGLPARAMETCDEVLKIYKGYPYFAINKAHILMNLSHGRSETEKQNMKSDAYNLALRSMWWNGRQNWVHSISSWLLGELQLHNPSFIEEPVLNRGIALDYPFRVKIALYNQVSQDILPQWAHTDVFYHDIAYTNNHTNKQNKRAAEILADLEGRFEGSPKKAEFLRRSKIASGGPVDEKQLLLQDVGENTQDWDVYEKLAKLYILEENYVKAAECLRKFPAFQKDSGKSSVAVSNYACSAGDLLFWRGAATEARSFYKLSADLDTGSGGCLISHEYLARLDLDMPVALEYALREARRYEDPSAYNDYMAYLHLTGQSSTAWSLFKTLLGRYKAPYIWTSALVGHRIQGTSTEQLVEWMRQISQLSETCKKRLYLARFGLMCLIDRPADPKMVDAIHSFDDPAFYETDKRYYIMPSTHKMMGPGKESFLPAEKRKSKPKPFMPFFVSFAKAYDLMKEKKYAEAFDILMDLNWYHSYENMYYGHSLKMYFVWAGIKGGAIKEIDRHFRIMEPEAKYEKYHDFDYELALAAYKGGTGKHDDAIKYLKTAFAIRPKSLERPLPSWYQIVELCEWLFEDSGDARYKELALKWARAYRTIMPMCAWAYAVEANYSQAHDDRIRALALAQYLDPQSSRIAHFDAAMRKEAAAWMKRNNPFRLDKTESESQGV
jgi:hypothetical protein